MAEQQKVQWENIKTSGDALHSGRSSTQRCPVPGGWLVRHEHRASAKQSGSSMVFVSDQDHLWNMEVDPFAWEKIDESRSANSTRLTFRAKVPGGWLLMEGYNVETWLDTREKIGHLDLSLVFVPDETHAWK